MNMKALSLYKERHLRQSIKNIIIRERQFKVVKIVSKSTLKSILACRHVEKNF